MIDYNGLRKRSTYNELVDFIEDDPLRIQYPDRNATQMRESPYLTQLDGEGMRQMEQLEFNKIKEQQKQHAMKQIAQATGQSMAEVQAGQPPPPHGFSPDQLFGTTQQQQAAGAEAALAEDAASSEGSEDEPDDFQHPQSPGPNMATSLMDPDQSPTMFMDTHQDLTHEMAAQAAMSHNAQLEEQIHTLRLNATSQAAGHVVEIDNLKKQYKAEKAELLKNLQENSAALAEAINKNDVASKLNIKAIKKAQEEAHLSLSEANQRNLQELKHTEEQLREQHENLEGHRIGMMQEYDMRQQQLNERAFILDKQSFALGNTYGLQSSGSMVAYQPQPTSQYLEDYPLPLPYQSTGQSSGSMSQPQYALQAPPTLLAIEAPRAKRRSTSSHPKAYQAAEPETAGESEFQTQLTISGWGRAGIPTLQRQLQHYGMSVDAVSKFKNKQELVEAILKIPAAIKKK